MAWISVHEQVIGGKLRSLSSEIGCSQNEALGLLVRLWLWGINNATPDGKMESASKSDVADVLNIGIDKRYVPENVVEAMIKTGWIDFDGSCLYIHDWKEWQKQWYKALKIRSDDKKRKAKERGKYNIGQESSNETIPEPLPAPPAVEGVTQPTTPPELPKRNKTEYTTEFESFWSLYPRKVGKGEAYKCYKARLKDGWNPSELIEAAQNYAQEVAKKRTEQEYIKHPKTFLSANTPFADYIKIRSTASEVALHDEDDPYADWRG